MVMLLSRCWNTVVRRPLLANRVFQSRTIFRQHVGGEYASRMVLPASTEARRFMSTTGGNDSCCTHPMDNEDGGSSHDYDLKIQERLLDREGDSMMLPKRWTHEFPGFAWGFQLLSVKIREVGEDYVDDKGRIGVYGKICAYDRMCNRLPIPLYRRDKANCEYVKLGDPLVVPGPRHGVYWDDFDTDVHLVLYIVGRGRCKDRLLCSIGEHSDLDDDLLRIETVVLEGPPCKLEYTCAAFMEAVEATVEVFSTRSCSSLLKRMVAYLKEDGDTKFEDYVQNEIVLFDRKWINEPITCNSDSIYRLWCSVLVVPFGGELLLKIDVSSGDDISHDVKYKFRFPVMPMDEEVVHILHKYGSLALKISWSSLKE